MNNIILPENIEHKQKMHEPEKEVFYQFIFRFESNESLFPNLNL